MNRFDDTIHQPMRLRIMAALRGLPANEYLEFRQLKAICEATDGNLGAHLGTLENAGYVTIVKDFAGKRPRTRIAATPAGLQAFDRHVRQLRSILDMTTDTDRTPT